MGHHAKAAHRARPHIEGLETRQLLSGGKTILRRTGEAISDDDLKTLLIRLTENVSLRDRRIAYSTPEGARVVVNLYGRGTLRGTKVRPDGALDIVFNNTDKESRIIATVKGRHGRKVEVPLASVRDADTPARDNSTTGVNPIAALQLRDFRLIDGGFVNLMGGVLQVNMRSVGRGASMYLLEGQPITPSTTTGNIIATGGASVGGVNQISSAQVTEAVPSDGPPGIEIRIDRVEAGPLNTPPFGNPQVFAVDPAAGTLISFDTKTGNPTLTIPIPALTDTTPPVGLATRGDELLVLVGNDQQVLAFNAVTGASAGSFNTSNLAGLGLTEVGGIGSSSSSTVLTAEDGTAVRVDVAASLATGQAVSVGSPFVPQREFVLNGDATGIAGLSTLYAAGAAHFDTFQPNSFQFGSLTLNQFGPGFAEQARTAISPFTNAGSDGLDPTPFTGFGSIDGSLAVLGTAAGGSNFITLRNPTTLAPTGGVRLNYAPQLYGLSESLHPELQNASLIDISGALKRFVGKNITGLVINTRGGVNLISIHTAVDSAFIGRPLNHVEFIRKENVQLISTTRGELGTQNPNDITIDKNLAPTGPLVIP